MFDGVQATSDHRFNLRRDTLYLLPSTLLVLFLFARCFLFNEQLIFRDAGHFYYPYFQLQVQQWKQGEIPFWNPHENGGEPLAGNPTASVFYPGKLLFALFPYPLAYKVYLIGHLILAGWTSYIAARWAGLSRSAACITSLAYAGSGTILFQVYNIVFLVGAAWLPIGMMLGWRLAIEPTASATIGLASVTAIQILGGDPQAAQLTLVFSLVSAAFLQLSWMRASLLLTTALGTGSGIISFTGPIRSALDSFRQTGSWTDLLAALASSSWQTALHGSLALLCVVTLLNLALRWRHEPAIHSIAMLLLAGVLGIALASIQVLPTLEFTSLSGRSSPDVPTETVAFSLHPARLVEFILPEFWGAQLPVHARWFPWAEQERSIWVPNLYAGLLPFLLAISAISWFAGPPARRWLTWMMLVWLLLSFGKFGDGNWLINPDAFKPISPLDLERGARMHGDSTGLYWLAEQTIPGFRQFRYPSKLLVFIAWGMAMLAGHGVDTLISPSRDRRLLHVALGLGGFLLLAPVAAALGSPWLRRAIESRGTVAGSFGPFQLDAALNQLFLTLVISALFAAATIVLFAIRYKAAKPSRVWIIALTLLTGLDLVIAHRAIPLTIPQSLLDIPPEAITKIDEYHQRQHPGEIFRVHRTRLFEPIRFYLTSSSNRVAEQAAWERQTAQPKYALPSGIDYTKTEGTMNLFDLDFFFSPWVVPVPPSLQTAPDRRLSRLVYYPRVGFDLWNTRYFILPKETILDDVERGSLTLLTSKRGEPLPVVASWPADQDDCLILDNIDALPRARMVHEVDLWPSIHDLHRASRVEPMERLLYRSIDAGLPLWQGTPYGDYPIERRALIEPTGQADADLLQQLHAQRSASSPNSTVQITEYRSQRVTLDVQTPSLGILVLADTFYPGWQAWIDGKPATIHRANRLMRGVIIPPGRHDVRFQYFPTTFYTGAAISAASLLLILVIMLTGLLRRK
jgi:hypothetical protein